MNLHLINGYVLDGLSSLMLLAFAFEAAVRVYAMTKSAVIRALKGDE